MGPNTTRHYLVDLRDCSAYQLAELGNAGNDHGIGSSFTSSQLIGWTVKDSNSDRSGWIVGRLR